MSAECPELEELEHLLARGEVEALTAIQHGIEQTTLIAEREIVLRTPTNKYTTGGTLRASIQSQVVPTQNGAIGIVGTELPYAPFVEEDTRPHQIRARHKRALAFSPAVGFQVVYRDVATMRRLSRTTVMSAPAGSFVAQRGRAIYRMGNRTTMTLPRADRVVVRSVRHPGTTGYHMFRDGAMATVSQMSRVFAAQLRALLRRLAGR